MAVLSWSGQQDFSSIIINGNTATQTDGHARISIESWENTNLDFGLKFASDGYDIAMPTVFKASSHPCSQRRQYGNQSQRRIRLVAEHRERTNIAGV